MSESFSKSQAAREGADRMDKTAKVGTGKRFNGIQESARASDSKNPRETTSGRKKQDEAHRKKISTANRKKH